MGRFIRLLWAFCLSYFYISLLGLLGLVCVVLCLPIYLSPTLDMFYCVYLWWRPHTKTIPNVQLDLLSKITDDDDDDDRVHQRGVITFSRHSVKAIEPTATLATNRLFGVTVYLTDGLIESFHPPTDHLAHHTLTRQTWQWRTISWKVSPPDARTPYFKIIIIIVLFLSKKKERVARWLASSANNVSCLRRLNNNHRLVVVYFWKSLDPVASCRVCVLCVEKTGPKNLRHASSLIYILHA